MRSQDFFRIASAVVSCKLMRYGFGFRLPYRLIVNITNMCNSRCLTCGIWKIYADDPDKLQDELTLDEFNKIFRSAPGTLWLTPGGGEPFLREDLVDIINCAASIFKNLIVVDLSTNGLLPDRVEKVVLEVLETTRIPHLEVAVSLDGAPNFHERIRGVEGSWKKGVKTYKRLLEVASRFENFSTHINYTLSSYNAGMLSDLFISLEDEGLRITPEDISISIAHLGMAFSNISSDGEFRINNSGSLIKALCDIDLLIGSRSLCFLNFDGEIRGVVKRIFLNLAKTRYLKNPDKTVIPCAAGFSSCFIDPYGNVFPCTIWNKKLGNLREVNYDLNRIWRSEKAEQIRRKIKAGLCPNCWSGCESWQSIAQNMPFILKFL